MTVLVASLSVHEAAHAWAANQLGDPTARRLGRLSLNPAVHVDLVGTVLFPLVAITTGLPLIGWAKPVPVDSRHLRSPRAGFRADCRGRPDQQRPDGAARRHLLVLPAIGGADAPTRRSLARSADFVMHQRAAGGLQHDAGAAARWRQRAAGRAAAASGASLIDRLRPYGFILLYALMLTGVLWPPSSPSGQRFVTGLVTVTEQQRVVSGMRPTGKLHLGHLVGALHNWVRAAGAVRLLLLRRRLARADERLRRHQRDRRERATTTSADWIGAGPRSGEEHVLRPVAGARARRAVPAAVDGHADPVARARADLQGAEEQLTDRDLSTHRLPRLSAAADRRHRHLRRALRAGRRGPGAAPRAVARGRAPLQQLLSARSLVEPQPLLTPIAAAARASTTGR